MSQGRRARGWVVGVAGLAVVAGTAAFLVFSGGSRREAGPAGPDAGAMAGGPAEGVRRGEAAALAALVERLKETRSADGPIGEAEAAELVDAVAAIRAGFLKFAPEGKVAALGAVGLVLERFGRDRAPGEWVGLLEPVQDTFGAALADPEVAVRVEAMARVGQAWTWLPNRALMPVEEQQLALWMEGFYSGVVRRLADADPRSRAAAIACLGRLPIDEKAAPAVANVDFGVETHGDPHQVIAAANVRIAVLAAFGRRVTLLSDDAVLRRLNDPMPEVGQAAEVVLKARGLTQEQIGLGRMLVHAKPEVRASVIALLLDREDIDPVVWLIQLSHDAEESVRAKAVEALAGRDVPEARRRLAEMAANDASPSVRQAAAKAVPPAETTAALPPLPGSPSLSPKAN